MRSLSILLLIAQFTMLQAQQNFVANLDESKVGNLPIPDPLICEDGSKVTTKEQWLTKRRPELLRLFESEVYGKTPTEKLKGIRYVTTSENKQALEGTATMHQVSIYLTDKEQPRLDVLLYLPNGRSQPAPVFVSPNFMGNQSTSDDPSIALSAAPHRNDKEGKFVNNRATEKSRAAASRRWPMKEIIARGYGVATVDYFDIDPDTEDFTNGVHPLFYKEGQTKPAADEWGAIGAWAWGMSRIVDYLETLPEVDGKKFISLGHSRLGKTALWAGAQDERFAIVLSNDSGAGGAALGKRIFGETVGRLNSSFPHWFCGNFKKYSKNEEALPVDQHELIALCAPRPVYVASATGDTWADPKGEFLGAKLAEPVYALFGMSGLGASEQPAPDSSVSGQALGYHLRTGQHDILLYDWEQYMNFADKHWGKPQ